MSTKRPLGDSIAHLFIMHVILKTLKTKRIIKNTLNVEDKLVEKDIQKKDTGIELLI